MAADATGIREYKGAAVQSVLTAGINASSTSFPISPTTNWPTGAVGNFSIVIDQGTSAEESILCSAQATGVITVVTRGYDNTAAVGHSTGAIVTHGPTAIDVSEANYIANVHAQTSKAVPVGADEVPLFDSAATFGLKKSTLTNLWAALASLTQTLTNKTLTSPVINTPTGIVKGDVGLGSVDNTSDVTKNAATVALTNKDLTSPTNTFPAQIVVGKNALINGGMDLWNRGTSSFAIASGTPQYTADRWTCYFNGTGTITQETSVIPSNSKYALRITATATSTDNRIYQLIETNNVLPYAGKAITISVQMAGTVGIPAGVTLAYSTSVDDTLTNTSTSITLTTVTTPALSNSLQTYVFTGTIPSTAKTLRVGIGTNAVVNTNYLVIANAQLELGSTATIFSRAGGSIGGELALVKRYLPNFTGNGNRILGIALSTTSAQFVIPFDMVARIAPTGITTSSVANFGVYNKVFAFGAATAIAFDSAGINAMVINVTTVAGTPTLVAGDVCSLQFSNNSALLYGTGVEL